MLTQAAKTLVPIVMRGGFVMIPLLTAAVVAMTVILERLILWRRLRVRRGESGGLAPVAEGDLPPAVRAASASRHPVARVLGAGIAATHLSPGGAMQAAAQVEVSQARRYLPIPDTVITSAPLLGLLGTITGMTGGEGPGGGVSSLARPLARY
jgi:biopolymer transport protein ExbB